MRLVNIPSFQLNLTFFRPPGVHTDTDFSSLYPVGGFSAGSWTDRYVIKFYEEQT